MCAAFQDLRMPNHPPSGQWLQGPLRDCARNGTDDGALARSLLDAGAATGDIDRVSPKKERQRASPDKRQNRNLLNWLRVYLFYTYSGWHTWEVEPIEPD